MSIPIFTLRTVTSGGALDQFLPDFQSLDISPVFSAPGVVAIKYPENGVNFGLLHDDLEIAVLLNGVEVPELRSVIESTDGDDASDASNGQVWNFTARTLLGRLDQAVVYPGLWPTSHNPPNQEYTAASPGKILGDLIAKAHSRGALSWLTYDFSDTLDSSGAAWVNSLDISYDAGTTYLDVVANLVNSSVVEVTTSGRVLRAFNPNTLGTDKTTGSNPLRFLKGRDMKESPRKSSSRELSTVVLVAGKNNSYVERVADSGSLTTWGRRELSYSANNVETPGVLDVIGDSLLETVKTPKLEITHGLHFEVAENPKPITDFVVGDWALSDVGRGWESYRIKQWVISVDTAGTVTGSVTLNQLIDERIAQLNQKIADLNNGIVSSGSSEETDDGKAPAVPTGLSVVSNYYIQGGRARAVATFDWSDVTTNADSTPLSDLAGYTARWRYSSDAVDLWRSVKGIDAGTSVAFFDNIDTGAVIKLQVEAHDKYGRSSGYSALQTHTTAADTTPPLKTSSPVVTSNVGTLRVLWDGKNSTGGSMDSDIAGVEVHVGPNGTFTPDSTTLRDFLPAAAQIATTITSGLSYGTEYWVRLVAVDTSGNKGPASDETSTSHVILLQVVNVEIGSGEVGLNNTRFSDIGNLIDDGNFENQQVRGVRTAAATGLHFTFDNSTSSVGSWSIRSDSYAGGATELLQLQGALPCKPGERIFGAADFKSTTSVPGTSFLRLSVKWLNSGGNYIDNTGAVNNVDYALTDNWQAAVDNAWHSRVSGSSQVAPVNASSFEIWLINISRTAGTIWADAVEVRRQIDTLLVSDAAITTAKIANLAVNNAKISDLSVGKLTTGTLGADIVVGARIKTADTGARVELNSSGLQTFDGSGNQTVNIASADGSVTIIGQLKSGTSGRRIEINPTSTFLPEIRFYPSSGSNYGFLNAVSSGTDVSVGLNSGQFTANGQTCEFRVYMQPNLATYEIVRVDTQAQWGGGIDVKPDGVSIDYMGSSRQGFMDAMGDHASIGYNSDFDSADVWWRMDNTGIMSMIGRWDNYAAIAANQGTFQGIISLSSANGVILTYGSTMLGGMGCGGTLVDTGSLKSWQITAANSTGYSASFSAAVNGAWVIWTFRC